MLLQNNKSNGIYSIVDQNDILFPVYCDFGSKPGMAWTLFQSHSLQNKVACRKSFYLHDLPVNQDAPEWNREYDGWMNEWTLFIADDVGNGHPVSRARGSCIKRSTKGKK